MQAVLATKSGGDEGNWRVFVEVSAYFAVVVIIMLVTVCVGLGAIIFDFWAWQFQFGYQSRKRSCADTRAANMWAWIGGGGGRRPVVLEVIHNQARSCRVLGSIVTSDSAFVGGFSPLAATNTRNHDGTEPLGQVLCLLWKAGGRMRCFSFSKS